MNSLSIKDCLSFGWRTFTARPLIFIAAGAVVFGAQLIVNIVTGGLEYLAEPGSAADVFISIVVLAISMAVSTLIGLGTISFVLKAHDDPKAATLKDLWAPERFWHYLGASVLIGVLVLIGLILLIVPGIILSVGLFAALYLVVDKKMDIIPALKHSWEMTKGNRWKVFLLMLSLLAINLVGMLALLVGLIVSVPVSYLATAHAYRSLSK